MASGYLGSPSGNVIVPVANLMKRTKQVAVAVSDPTNWVTTESQAIFFADSNGKWWMTYHYSGYSSVDNITAGKILTLTGITFADVNVSGHPLAAVGSNAAAHTVNVYGYGQDNASILYIGSVADDNYNSISLNGTVRLNAEPTTYTTAANMEGAPSVAAYIPLVTLKSFTTGSGTYTTPSGVRWLRVRLVGGGGGGGASVSSNARQGSNGADTTFGSSVAKGGGGGSSFTTPSGGVGGTTGTIGGDTISGFTIAGGGGAAGVISAGSHVYQPGGSGGNSYFGGGGGTVISGAAYIGAANTGGGGGGGSAGGAALYTGGGGGAGGYTEVLIVPTTNQEFSYSVASAAGGGTTDDGTNGNSGGSGGSGIIIVEEQYI